MMIKVNRFTFFRFAFFVLFLQVKTLVSAAALSKNETVITLAYVQLLSASANNHRISGVVDDQYFADVSSSGTLMQRRYQSYMLIIILSGVMAHALGDSSILLFAPLLIVGGELLPYAMAIIKTGIYWLFPSVYEYFFTHCPQCQEGFSYLYGNQKQLQQRISELQRRLIDLQQQPPVDLQSDERLRSIQIMIGHLLKICNNVADFNHVSALNFQEIEHQLMATTEKAAPLFKMDTSENPNNNFALNVPDHLSDLSGAVFLQSYDNWLAVKKLLKILIDENSGQISP